MTLPATLPAYERAARQALPKDVAAYLFGGAGAERTLEANLAAFDGVRLVPRAFAQPVESGVELLGHRYAAPILVAPMGHQRLFHPGAEQASARAASALGLGFIAPTLASASLEDIRAASEGAPQWFQLYMQPERAWTRELLRHAEALGFGAIVVTADAPVDGVRDRQIEAGFQLPLGSRAGRFMEIAAAGGRNQELGSSPPGWDDLAWLRSETRLPLIVKGVMCPTDALRALDVGSDALVVSNHGGRVLDGATGALDRLPEVVDAVGSRMPVLFDSGIRRGVDVAKARRLGAAAVLVGRPAAWGLAVAGDRGAAHVLKMLMEEYQIADSLSGPKLATIAEA